MNRIVLAALIVAAAVFAVTHMGVDVGAAERDLWDFTIVGISAPDGPDKPLSDIEGHDRDGWNVSEMTGVREHIAPWLDKGWEPIGATWALGRRWAVQLRRRR